MELLTKQKIMWLRGLKGLNFREIQQETGEKLIDIEELCKKHGVSKRRYDRQKKQSMFSYKDFLDDYLAKGHKKC